MKILMGSFQCEANSFCDGRAKAEDFEVWEGEAAIEKMAATPVFRAAGAELIPLIYASCLPTGMVSHSAYDYFENIFRERIRPHLDADGIYLYLHGSMYVEGYGSGEDLLVKMIRDELGYRGIISVSLDFHANLPASFVKRVNSIQGFRTAPHTDQDDTERRAAASLLKCLQSGQQPVPAFVRVPFLGGDACTTDREPFLSVTRILQDLDRKEEVISCAFFSGQAWYDAPYVGDLAVVSATDDSAWEKAQYLAKTFWEGRALLTLEGAMTIEETIEAAGAVKAGLLFVTDSGDNTTAGANGEGTLLLKHFLKAGIPRVLICGILSRDITDRLLSMECGYVGDLTFCEGLQEQQRQEITLKDVTLKGKGTVFGWAGDIVGEGVLISSGPLDIVLTNARAAFTTPEHFSKMNVDVTQYRVIVIKLGYLFPKLRPMTDHTPVFCMTPGASTNDFATLPFRHLGKKMYPMDQDITWEDILCDAGRENQ